MAGDDEDFDISEGEDGRIAINSTGTSLVVWEAEDLDESGVFARLYDADSLPMGDVFQVNSSTLEDQDQPDVTALSTDDFVVVWRSNHDARETIQAQRFQSDGMTLGGEFQIDKGSGLSESPVIGADDTGRFVVVWSSADDLFVRLFDSTGVPLGNEEPFAMALPAAAPAIGVAPDGDFLVVWEDGEDVRGQRFDTLGLPIGAEFVVNETTGDEQSEPAVTAAGGAFMVAWRSEGQDTDGSAIYARRVEALPVGEEFQVNTRTFGDQIQPAISTDAEDNILITWQSEGGQDGSSSGVFGRFMRPPRRPVCPDFLINTRTEDAQRNSAVAGGLQEFAVIWQTEPAFPPPGNVALIQGRRVSSPLFADGFESGDLTAWSRAVP